MQVLSVNGKMVAFMGGPLESLLPFMEGVGCNGGLAEEDWDTVLRQPSHQPTPLPASSFRARLTFENALEFLKKVQHCIQVIH